MKAVTLLDHNQISDELKLWNMNTEQQKKRERRDGEWGTSCYKILNAWMSTAISSKVLVFNLPRFKENYIKIHLKTVFHFCIALKSDFNFVSLCYMQLLDQLTSPGRAYYATLESIKWKEDIRQGT